jgi:hypothetical protein
VLEMAVAAGDQALAAAARGAMDLYRRGLMLPSEVASPSEATR